MYFQNDIKHLLTADDIRVLDAYRDQVTLSLKFQSLINQFRIDFSGYFMDRNFVNLASHRLAEIEDSLKECLQDLKTFTLHEKMTLRLKLSFDTLQDTISIKAEEPLASILGGVYGYAVRYNEVVAKANGIAEELDKKKQAEHDAVYYSGTYVKRFEYPNAGKMQLSPTDLRAGGFIPEGYELVPMEVLALLIHAGRDPYSLAVGGDTMAQRIRQASRAAENVVNRRPTSGKPNKKGTV